MLHSPLTKQSNCNSSPTLNCCSLSRRLGRVSGVLGATQAEIEHHLEMGRKLLAAGQLAEALSHYHSAVGKITRVRSLTFGSLLHEAVHIHTHVPSERRFIQSRSLWSVQREIRRTT